MATAGNDHTPQWRTAVVAIALFLLLDLGLWALSSWPLGRLDPAFALFGRWWAIAAAYAWVRRWPAARRGALIILAMLLSSALMAAMGVRGGIVIGGDGSFGVLIARHMLVACGLGLVAYALMELLAYAAGFFRQRRMRAAVAAVAVLITGFSLPVAVHALLAQAYAATAPLRPGSKPALTVMTALPLPYGADSGDFVKIARGEAQPHPALRRLAAHYRITLIDQIAPETLRDGALLVLIQPRILSPEELVLLDQHAAKAGAVIIADDQLQWPLPFPLGDRRNPPFRHMLTPLFDHWGLAVTGDGIAMLSDPPADARASRCAGSGPVAQCSLSPAGGAGGQVLLFNDADFLDAPAWVGPGRNGLNAAGWRGQSFALFEARLASMAGRPTAAPMLAPIWQAGDNVTAGSPHRH